MARPEGSAKELERRRRRAMRLLDEGRTLGEVARIVGCHASSVMRWRDARAREGDEGLKPSKASGRPPKLSEAHSERLLEVLLEGAVAQGYRTELWTTQRIAAQRSPFLDHPVALLMQGSITTPAYPICPLPALRVS